VPPHMPALRNVLCIGPMCLSCGNVTVHLKIRLVSNKLLQTLVHITVYLMSAVLVYCKWTLNQDDDDDDDDCNIVLVSVPPCVVLSQTGSVQVVSGILGQVRNVSPECNIILSTCTELKGHCCLF